MRLTHHQNDSRQVKQHLHMSPIVPQLFLCKWHQVSAQLACQKVTGGWGAKWGWGGGQFTRQPRARQPWRTGYCTLSALGNNTPVCKWTQHVADRLSNYEMLTTDWLCGYELLTTDWLCGYEMMTGRLSGYEMMTGRLSGYEMMTNWLCGY